MKKNWQATIFLALFLLLGGPKVVGAQGFLTETIASLKAQIAELEARLAKLQGLLLLSPEEDLLKREYRLGESGEAVTQLQDFLLKKGFFPLARPTGYFGTITKQALESYLESVEPPSSEPVISPIVTTMATSSTQGTTTPVLPRENPELVATNPPDGAIDARVPTAKRGWQEFEFELTSSIEAGEQAPLPGEKDFTVVATSEPRPKIVEIIRAETPDHLIVKLDRAILPGERLRLAYKNNQVVVNFAFLPGDVDQNGKVSYEDLLLLLDVASGVKKGLPLYATDVDRSGAVNRADQLAWLNLINGSEGFEVWRGRTLPAPLDSEAVINPQTGV